jgi:acetyl-CoA carboxylase beta subunit
MPALSRLKQIFQNKFEKITLPLENDILICSGEGTISGSQVVLIAISHIGELQIEHLDSFLITIQHAIAVRMPLIVISSGMNHSKSKISLSYIAQIAIEMNFHKQMNLLQISVLTDGNMTDSLSAIFPLGDLTLVEWEAEDNRLTKSPRGKMADNASVIFPSVSTLICSKFICL